MLREVGCQAKYSGAKLRPERRQSLIAGNNHLYFNAEIRSDRAF
jgi:hypothetical protein